MTTTADSELGHDSRRPAIRTPFGPTTSSGGTEPASAASALALAPQQPEHSFQCCKFDQRHFFKDLRSCHCYQPLCAYNNRLSLLDGLPSYIIICNSVDILCFGRPESGPPHDDGFAMFGRASEIWIKVDIEQKSYSRRLDLRCINWKYFCIQSSLSP